MRTFSVRAYTYVFTYAYLNDDYDNYTYDGSVYVCGHICVSSAIVRNNLWEEKNQTAFVNERTRALNKSEEQNVAVFMALNLIKEICLSAREQQQQQQQQVL